MRGVPIPVFYCADCGEVYATPESFKKVEELALSAQDGIDRWFDTDAAQLVPKGAQCAKCNGTAFTKETDILDVWFDSGASNRAVCELRPELTWPVDLYFEGSDQHRGWFQLTLIPTVAAKGEPPFKSVVTHGFVVDGEGKKMSKKLGNVVALTDLVNNLGADVVRLWVSSENYRQDIRISDEILKRMQDAYRRIRNTFRYMLGVLNDFTVDNTVALEDLEEVDRWALHRMQSLRERVLKAYDEYEFHAVYHAVHSFCAVDMSAFYLDIIKDRLYTFAPDSRERRAAQTVLANVLVDLLKLVAPVLVYTTDEAWESLPDSLKDADSVHLSQFTEAKPQHVMTEGAVRNWDQLLRLRGVVSKVLEEARRRGEIGSSQQAAVTLTPGDEQTADLLNQYADQLESVFIVSACSLEPVSGEAAGTEDKLQVCVSQAPGAKCARCWNYRESVGASEAHPSICSRCEAQLGDLTV